MTKKRLTILYVLHTTNPGNGATVAFKNMLQGLMSLGIKPVVALPDKKGIYKKLKEQGIPTICCPNYRLSTYPTLQGTKNKMLFLPRLVIRLILAQHAIHRIVREARALQIDLVHTNTSALSIGFHVAKLLGVPHIYHIREYADKIGLHIIPSQNTLVSQLNDQRSYAICISHDLQNYYHLSNNNAIVSYDGCCYHPTSLPNKKREPFFLFVGRVQQAKGIDMLLDAYATYHALSKAPYKIQIAGNIADHRYFLHMSAFIHTHGLENDIHFLGQRSDIDQLMQRASAIILASPYEGFGLTFMEAARNGCLAIGRNTTGVKEQMDNGKKLTGADIALPFLSVSELASAMLQVDKNGINYYDGYIKRAFQVVCNDLYDKRRNTQLVFDFYHNIIQKENF